MNSGDPTVFHPKIFVPLKINIQKVKENFMNDILKASYHTIIKLEAPHHKSDNYF